MNKQTTQELEELKKTLDGVPDNDWTTLTAFNNAKSFYIRKSINQGYELYIEFQSLKDIGTIIERHNQAVAKDKQIAELRKEVERLERERNEFAAQNMLLQLTLSDDSDIANEALMEYDNKPPTKRDCLAIRDLEMQAKGIEDAIESKSFNKVYYISGESKVENICTTEDLIDQATKLRQQAKELDK